MQRGPSNRLVAGVLLGSTAGWVFGGIAANLSAGTFLTRCDLQMAGWLHVQATPAGIEAASAITLLGSPQFLGGVSLAGALLLARRRCWYSLLTFALTMGGGALLIPLLKRWFHRPRPTFEDAVATLVNDSFPSGHVMGATLLCGVSVFLLRQHVTAGRWRGAAIPAGCAFVLLVACTRLYLGVHYLSDVLGAVAAGVAWLALSLTMLAGWRRGPTSESPG